MRYAISEASGRTRNFLLPLLLAVVCSSGANESRGATQLITNLNNGLDQKLVVYGTSLTQNGAWANVTAGSGGLYDWLRGLYGSRFTMINSGMAGKASNSGVANLSARVIAQNPNTVIIEFAMNDATTGYPAGDIDYGISVSQSKANLNTMIDRILMALPNAEIILTTMNPAIDVPPKQAGTLRPNLTDYYQGYRDVASARGLLLIDHYVNWEFFLDTDAARFSADVPDGLHPGNLASLAVTLPAVQKALLGSAPTPPAISSSIKTEGNGQVSLFWTASKGAISYTVKRSTVSGGSYADVGAGIAATTFIDNGVVNGTSYYYIVNAVNGFGSSANSPQVTALPAANGVAIVDDPSARITYSPGWTKSADLNYFNGTKAVSTTAGSSAALDYTGTTIAVYAKKLQTGGIVDIYIDNVFAGSADTYSATDAFNVSVFSRVLARGPHRIEVRTTSRQNPQATGHSFGFDHFNYRP
jgi:acyl-CoA thioesterase I